MACSLWQGWGDSRIRVRDAIPAAKALANENVAGAKRFIETCHKIGSWENALVPEPAIEKLVMDNMHPLMIDTSELVFLHWIRVPGLRSVTSESIQSVYLKGLYEEFTREHGTYPVVQVVRCIVRGILRNGPTLADKDVVLLAAMDEMRSTFLGACLVPVSRRTQMAAFVVSTASIILLVLHVVLNVLFPFVYMTATEALSAAAGVDVVKIPIALLFLSFAASIITPSTVWLASARWAKARNAARHGLPITLLAGIVSS